MRLHQSLIDNITEWSSTFRDRNILLDSELGRSVTDVNALLEDLTMEALKADPDRRTLVGNDVDMAWKDLKRSAPPERVLVL